MATFYEKMRNCLSINFRIVALMGCRLRGGAAPTTTTPTAAAAAPSFADKLPMFYVIFTETLALLGQINFVAARWSRDPDLAMQCIGHALNNTLCLSKGFLLLLNTGRLRGLLDELLRNWRRYQPTRAEDRARIARSAEKSLMLSKVLMVSTLSCIVGFGLPPLFNLAVDLLRHGSGTNDDRYNRTSPSSLDYSKRIFLIEYPFPIVEPATYALVFLSEELMCVIGGMFYVGCDTTFAQLLTHITLQIKVLRLDVEAFVDRQSSDAEQMRKLILLVQRHRNLLRLCETLRQMYNPVIGVLVLISSVNICFNIFEMSQEMSEGKYSTGLVHASILTMTMLQVFYYCSFAETLREQAELLADSIYSSDWADLDAKFRRDLLFFVTRAQIPVEFTGFKIFRINHRRITSILRKSYTFYMVLQTSK